MSVTRSEAGAQHALGHPGTLTHPGTPAHGGTLGHNGTLARPVTLSRPGAIGRAATPARTESTPIKWSARRFLMFVIVSCSVLWTFIIAATLQLWILLS
jgi:hypothetical protein